MDYHCFSPGPFNCFNEMINECDKSLKIKVTFGYKFILKIHFISLMNIDSCHRLVEKDVSLEHIRLYRNHWYLGNYVHLKHRLTKLGLFQRFSEDMKSNKPEVFLWLLSRALATPASYL